MFLDFYRKILLFHTISIVFNLDAFFLSGFPSIIGYNIACCSMCLLADLCSYGYAILVFSTLVLCAIVYRCVDITVVIVLNVCACQR